MIAASPSRLWLVPLAVLLLPVAAFCLLPGVIAVLALMGLVRFDFNILLAALPGLAVAVTLGRVLWTIAGDLLRPRPVLVIDDSGIRDSRASDALIAWSDIEAATSLRGAGRGGIVLDLRHPRETRLDPARAGTLLFEPPPPGVAHIAIQRMTVAPAMLEAAILERAEAAGATVGTAISHPRMSRRSLGM